MKRTLLGKLKENYKRTIKAKSTVQSTVSKIVLKHWKYFYDSLIILWGLSSNKTDKVEFTF